MTREITHNKLFIFAVVFREHRRLANKLTKDEMKALKGYMNDRLMQEHGTVLLQLENLRSEHKIKVQELQERIRELANDLQFKTTLLDQYKSSDESLAHVHRQRGQRLERRQSVLEVDIENHMESINNLKKDNLTLRSVLSEKETEVVEKKKRVEELQKRVEDTKDSLESDAEAKAQRLSKEVLKLKLEIDNKNKACQKLTTQLEDGAEEMDRLQKQAAADSVKAKDAMEKLAHQTKEYSTKCDQVTMLQYQLEQERKKIAEFQREMALQNGPQARRMSNDSDVDLSRMHGEYIRAQAQFIESRVKLLEEKIAMYRNEIRSITHEITLITDDISKSGQLCDRLIVHGNTVVEKVLKELCDNIRRRKEKLNALLDDMMKEVPAITTQDACDLRVDALSLKRLAENNKINDVCVRASRVLTRIDNCEKAQFNSKFVSSNTPLVANVQNDRFRVVTDIRFKRQDSNNGTVTDLRVRNSKQQESTTNGNLTEENNNILGKIKLTSRKQENTNGSGPVSPTNEKVFLSPIGRKSTVNGTLLSRPKHMNGHVNGSSASLWKRRHSVTIPCLSPTLLDLNMTPSPSPRVKKSGSSSTLNQYA